MTAKTPALVCRFCGHDTPGAVAYSVIGETAQPMCLDTAACVRRSMRVAREQDDHRYAEGGWDWTRRECYRP